MGLEHEPGPSTPYRPSPTASVSASGLASPAFSHRVSSRLQTVRTAEHLRVYNDLLPASSQPQTPQNVPEARHQSRLHGSYTAPVRRNSAQHGWTPTTATRSRRGRGGQRREHSPLGLQTPGFMGLYGGTENLDDTVLVEQMNELAEGGSRNVRARLSEGRRRGVKGLRERR
ncbi:hypothetical protein N0V88_000014 [Collariella sp. IMI 366227]|nr:hypothetical protein N0V88_000014 [Collariella sp. IMI 366227]